MNNQEFSNEFDTLLNSYNTITFGSADSTYSINLDEYEKSVYLTKAQEEIVVSLYTSNYQDSFESNEQTRRYLSSLVNTRTIAQKVKSNSEISDNSTFFRLPLDVWFITYETVTLEDESLCSKSQTILVTPVTQDEFYKIQRNPFKGATKHRALRLDITDNLVEIITPYKVKSYTIRYLKKPTPIVLIDLPNGLSIDRITTKTECMLDTSLHRSILDRAVQLAVTSRAPKTKESNSKESDN